MTGPTTGPDTSGNTALRDRIAGQLDRLLSGTLGSAGARAVALLAERAPNREATPERLEVWEQLATRYRARQPNVTQDGRAALLTAGAPGAGKSTAVDELALVDKGWRRLDADIVKDYLLEELVASGLFDDVFAYRLEDGRPVMPRELSGLVHRESVIVLNKIRDRCLRDGENIVIEGTMAWKSAARDLLDDLSRWSYREVTLIDVEVRREVARAHAVERWWAGRQNADDDLGGRWVPLSVIDRAYPDPSDRRSVCARNAYALFHSDLTRDFPIARLTVVDATGVTPTNTTDEQRFGKPH